MLDERTREDDGRTAHFTLKGFVEFSYVFVYGHIVLELLWCRSGRGRRPKLACLGRGSHLQIVIDGEEAGRLNCLLQRDLHMDVALLVVDDDVARSFVGIGDGHDVVLADLREALEHLHRLRVIRDLEGIGRDDAAAAERARGEARGASLEVGERGGSALFVRNLLLGCQRHVQRELRRDDQQVRRNAVAAHVILRVLDHFVQTVS